MKTNTLFRISAIAIFVIVSHFQLKATVVESFQSGDWYTPSTWIDGIIPGTGNHVIINPDHQITLNNNASVNELTLATNTSDDSTSLQINSSRRLTVNTNITLNDGGTGKGLIIVNGRLEVGGNINFSGDNENAAHVDLTGFASILDLKGEFVFANEGKYTTNTSSYGTIILSGTSVQNLYKSSGSIIPNLEITNTAGVNLMSTLSGMGFIGDLYLSSSSKLNLYAGISTAFGFLTTESSSELNVIAPVNFPTFGFYMFDNNSYVTFTGSTATTVNALSYGATYPNLTFQNSGGVTLGSGISVAGSLTIHDYAFNANGQTITLTSWSEQFVDVKGTVNKLHNLTINKNSQQVTLQNDLTIANNLTLTNGILNTGFENKIIIENTNAGAIAAFSSTSFINGDLRRHITTNTDTYAFPIGNSNASSGYFLVELVNDNLSGINYIDATIKGLTNHNAENFESLMLTDSLITYESVSSEAIWSLIPDAQPTSGTYGLRLHISNFAGLSDNSYAILKRIDNGNENDWTPDGTMNGVNGGGRLLSHGYALKLNYESFSEFGIGAGINEVGSLPITLELFQAFLQNNGTVVLDWVTGTEIDNDYFTIQKSSNGINFYDLKYVQGAGYSAMRKGYKAHDYNPYNGITYYRLLQTDFDGTMDTFHIVSVEKNFKYGDVTALYPNPAIMGSLMQIESSVTEFKHFIKVFNLSNGQLVFETTVEPENKAFYLPSDIAKGAYIVTVEGGTGVKVSLPLIIQ